MQEILARAAGKTITKVPVVYCETDIKRARSVLDRLLDTANRLEVSRISDIVRVNEEE